MPLISILPASFDLSEMAGRPSFPSGYGELATPGPRMASWASVRAAIVELSGLPAVDVHGEGETVFGGGPLGLKSNG